MFWLLLPIAVIASSVDASDQVQTLRDDFQQRREAFITQQLNLKFKVPKVDILHKPDFTAPVDGEIRPTKAKGITFSRKFAQVTSARALLLFSENRDLERANELVQEICDFYLSCEVEHIMAPDSFYWASEAYLNLYHLFGSKGRLNAGALNSGTEKDFLEMIWRYTEHSNEHIPMKLLKLSYEHQGYWYKSSENHWFMEVVTLWAFCEILADYAEYKDRMMPQGKTVSQMATYLSDYLKVYSRGRAARGFFTEVATTGYNGRMLAMFCIIQDYAKDPRLREMAKDFQDLYWAFWAEEQIAGERGGGKVRERSWKGLKPSAASITMKAWMYFGLGSRGTESTNPTLLNTVYSSYAPSDIVLRLILEREKQAPYEIVQRRMGKNVVNPPELGIKGNMKFYDVKGHLLRYSWCDEDFILGTIMRPPLDPEVFPIGSLQSWHHGLIVEGDDTVERVVPKVLLKDTFNEQYAVQSKGTLISRRLHNERNGNVPTGVFISNGLAGQMQQQGNAVFINNPKAYVAFRFVQGGYSDFDLSKLKEIVKWGIFLKADEMFTPMILEVAEPGMFKSFSAFKKAVLANDAKIKNGRLDYKTIYGDKLTLFTDPDGVPLINGKPIDYHPKYVYKSPYINSVHDIGIVDITVDGETQRLNFN
ncbi:MAG: hypothetical protein AB3N63_19145 [Puniceicoccaceae bacterium]